MNIPRFFSVAGGLIGAVAIAGIAATPAAYADPAPLKGSAFGVKIDVKLNDTELVDEGPLPSVAYPTGGDDSVIELDSRDVSEQSNGYVQAKVIRASSTAKDDVLTSRASVTDLNVRLKDADFGTLKLTAEVVTAKCTTGGKKDKAESVLAGVKLRAAGTEEELVAAGEKVAFKPNTTIKIDGVGKVVLNEQLKSANGGVTVNAIHVYLTPELKVLYGDIIVSQATCATGTGSDDPDPSPSDPGDNPDPSASASPGDPSEPEPSDSATAPGNGGGDDLPLTGFKLASFAGMGGALIAAGAGALWFARRRRTADAAE